MAQQTDTRRRALFRRWYRFNWLTGAAASNQMQFCWRLSAFVISAVVFAVHIACEHFRLRNELARRRANSSMWLRVIAAESAYRFGKGRVAALAGPAMLAAQIYSNNALVCTSHKECHEKKPTHI